MDNNQSPLSPEEELAQLRQKVAAYEAKEQAQQKKNKTIFKWASKLTSWFFIGPSLKKSVTTLVQEYRNPEQTIQEETVIDVGTNVLKRLTRVGCLGLTIALIPVILLAIQSLLLYQQNEKVDAQNKLITHQNSRLDQQTQLQEAERRSALVFLLGNTLEAINTELKEDYGKDSIRNLSPQLIGQIIALSRSLKPYRFLEEDTLIPKPLSPERGQLLVSLVESQLDDITFEEIILKANFEGADLRGADLKMKNLSSINLFGADLSQVDFSETDLSWAQLSETKIKEANLYRAYLRGIDLSKSDLSGAELVGARLMEADLSFANLSRASLKGADLRIARFHKANLYRINLVNASMSYKQVYLLTTHPSSVKYLKEEYYTDTIPHYDDGDFNKELPRYLIKQKK